MVCKITEKACAYSRLIDWLIDWQDVKPKFGPTDAPHCPYTPRHMPAKRDAAAAYSPPDTLCRAIPRHAIHPPALRPHHNKWTSRRRQTCSRSGPRTDPSHAPAHHFAFSRTPEHRERSLHRPVQQQIHSAGLAGRLDAERGGIPRTTALSRCGTRVFRWEISWGIPDWRHFPRISSWCSRGSCRKGRLACCHPQQRLIEWLDGYSWSTTGLWLLERSPLPLAFLPHPAWFCSRKIPYPCQRTQSTEIKQRKKTAMFFTTLFVKWVAIIFPPFRCANLNLLMNRHTFSS